MSWQYHCVVFVAWINSRSDCISQAMTPHTIILAVKVVCCCKAKVRLSRSPEGLYTRTRSSSLLKLNLDLSLNTKWFHSVAIQFRRARQNFKRRHRWLGAMGRKHDEYHDTRCPLASALRRAIKDTGPRSVGAACV
ncbi:uncharacterized protein TNCV_3901011 [Trichonephila clavipes]|nr:uncharacterized protein TNCV_3901011 [Trichonephila clavipes]